MTQTPHQQFPVRVPDDDEGVIDPDLIDIADYLDGALDDGAVRALRRRLKTDYDFRTKAMPYLKAARRKKGVLQHLALQDSLDAAFDQLAEERLYVDLREFEPAPPSKELQAVWDRFTEYARFPRSDVATGRLLDADGRPMRRPIKDWPIWGRALGFAALVFNIAGLGVITGELTVGMRHHAGQAVGVPNADEPGVNRSMLADSNLATRVVKLRDSSIVLLSPGAGFETHTVLARAGEPSFYTELTRGDAEIDVAARTPGFRVETATATIGLTPGRYRASVTDEQTLIRVDKGGAVLRRKGGGPGLIVPPGRSAVLRAGGAPTIVEAK